MTNPHLIVPPQYVGEYMSEQKSRKKLSQHRLLMNQNEQLMEEGYFDNLIEQQRLKYFAQEGIV